MNTCTQEDCDRLGYGGKGLCPTHYARQLKGYEAQEADHTPHQKCAVVACTIPATSRVEGAFCKPHYQIQNQGKDPHGWLPREKDASRTDRVCWVEDCQKRALTKRLCNYHYLRARRGLLAVPDELGVTLNPPCSFEGCTYLQESKGLCHGHNEQLRAGRDLKELREWGKYIRGEHTCLVDDCRRAATSNKLCVSHSRGVSMYKMTTEQTVELFRTKQCQNPGCTETKRLHIDHDHITGEVRGLLCSGCNTSLGHLGDDPERILGLVEYLRKHLVTTLPKTV